MQQYFKIYRDRLDIQLSKLIYPVLISKLVTNKFDEATILWTCNQNLALRVHVLEIIMDFALPSANEKLHGFV